MASFPFPYENYPNPNPNYTLLPPIIDPPSSFDFELSDYLILGDDVDQASSSQSFASSEKITGDSGGGGGADTGSTGAVSSNTNTTIKLSKNGVKKNKGKMGQRVAFRTKSEMEIMDDGYKWRKYGKKSVKNSPNPRNYYKCSSEGCNVKKRVEREKEDPSYVITTYEGIHNHESPFIISYNHIPPTQLIDQFLL